MRDNGVIVGTGATSEEAWIISRVNGIGSPRNKRIDARITTEKQKRTVTFLVTAISEIVPECEVLSNFNEEKFENNW